MNPDDLNPFLDRLKKSQAAKPVPEPSGAFEQNVMREVRKQAADAKAPWWLSLQPLVMRFATASVVAAVLMLGVGMSQGLAPSYEVAEIELEDDGAFSELPEL